MLRRQTSSSLVLEDLQRSNEELRRRLSLSLMEGSDDLLMTRLCEKETEELRSTVSRLERLLSTEREERLSNEEQALSLLSDVKLQWQERENARVSLMQSQVESAKAQAQEASKNLGKIMSELEESTSNLENALYIKNRLKDKCQDLKSKLENLKKSYKEKSQQASSQEARRLSLESEKETLSSELATAQEKLSQEKELHEDSKQRFCRQIKEKESHIAELKDQIHHLESALEKAQSQVREQAFRISALLSDIKEAHLLMDEIKGQESDAREKVQSLLEQLRDTETQMQDQASKHQEDLLASEEKRRLTERRDLERYKELQEEMERLLSEKEETSFCADESERKVRSLESEMKRMRLANKELDDKYRREKAELEDRAQSIVEQANASRSKLEGTIHKLKNEAQSIRDERDTFKEEKSVMEKELRSTEEASQAQIESLKLEIARQKEIMANPPSPVKVINNIVVDNSVEIESQRKALDYERSTLDTEKSELASKMEELAKAKKQLKEQTLSQSAASEKESTQLKALDAQLKEEEHRLFLWDAELKKEQKRLHEEELRLQNLIREIESSRTDFSAVKEEMEREFRSKSKSIKAELEETFAKERQDLKRRVKGLTEEKEELAKELKLREKKEAQKLDTEADKSKKEINLMKVDLRIANKQVNEHKETIKYLRQSYRDERDLSRKTQEENMELKAKEESLIAEGESLKQSLSSSEEDKKKMEELKDELSQKVSEAKNLGFKLSNAEFESERLSSRLEKAEKDVIKYRDSQTQLNIYKATCLELENQAKEFETVIEKLEEKNGKLSASLSESRKSSQEHESSGTSLKIEINDLKSQLIFANSQLKESNSKVEEMESIYKSEESKLRARLEEIFRSKEAHLGTINELKLQMEDLLSKCSHLSGEDSSHKLALKDLKESYSGLMTRYHDALDKSNKLTSQNEDLRIRLARCEDELQESLEETKKSSLIHKKLEHELMTQINQHGKLIDYLQSKLNKCGKGKSVLSFHQQRSDKENVNMVLPYEALREKLKDEETKNAHLLKELNSVRGELRSSRTKDNATILLPTPNDQRANHSIPHRWTSQTNMKVSKCSTCYGIVHFCRQASVCQYCHQIVHSHCAAKSLDDCGLPKTLAPVLKNSGRKEKPFEGYLKIPEQGGKYWMSVHVKILDDRLILKGEGVESKEIDLMPSNGFVYIQSSVVYTELLHTTAYDQPHVFKIGYSNSKDTHYFMAKSFSDKAMWIKEIENISLRMKYDDKALTDSDSDREESIPESLSRSLELAALDPSHNVYCVAPMKDSWLLGTSSGFLFVHSGVVAPVERSPSSVYQMEIVPSINKIVLITGQNRKLGVLNMDRIHSRDFNPVNLSAVKSCHLFGVGSVEKDVYLCAVDDCRVSIFKYEGESFKMVHKFSTDSPTSCLQFTSSSVLVITDKIYDIDLEDFAVEEFLDLDESPMTLSNNYPIAMFQINSNEFLLCFQERGLFVNSSGNKSRPDIKWNSISGQFAYSRGKLWVTYYNAVEVFDLSIKEQHSGSSKMMLAKNPQILSGQGHVYLLEERNSDLVLLELTKDEK